MDEHIVRPEDIRLAAAISVETLSQAMSRDWSRNAAGLEWTCQFTLDHIVGGLTAYAGDLAVRSTEQHEVLRKSRPDQSVDRLLQLVTVSGAVLSDVCEAAPDNALGFHPEGPADWSGFAAMGCTEILMHTDDICWAFHIAFNVEHDLSSRVLRRLFPWAPDLENPWQVLRWATGRGYLQGYASVGPDWTWHCKPLRDWNPGGVS